MVRYTIFLQFSKEKYLKKQPCNCVKQRCKGFFLPHIEGQKNCIFDIAENGLILDNK